MERGKAAVKSPIQEAFGTRLSEHTKSTLVQENYFILFYYNYYYRY